MMYYQMRIKVKMGLVTVVVGKVAKEIQIPVTDADDRNYLFPNNETRMFGLFKL